jgi:hypothetical protein
VQPPAAAITAKVEPLPHPVVDADVGDSVAHGVDVPVPDTAMVFGPLVWSPVILIVPLYVCAAVGTNWIVTVCVPPAAIVPLVQFAANTLNPVVIETPLMVNVAFPVFAIVNASVGWPPTWTLPNARLPLSAMMRVWAVVGGGASGDDGADGDELPQAVQPIKKDTVRNFFISFTYRY